MARGDVPEARRGVDGGTLDGAARPPTFGKAHEPRPPGLRGAAPATRAVPPPPFPPTAMPATLTIRDETASGAVSHEFSLDFLTEEITVRELIERRVYEEVQLYNASAPGYFRGLVQPVDAEATLDGYRMRAGRQIDWEAQRDGALRAFRKNGFFVIVGDRQVESLDERIRLELDTEVTFLKLVPLVGG